MRAHRVAWYLSYGEWPAHTVDHINGDYKDNRLCNLRDVQQQVNNRNLHQARSHNATNILGVTKFRRGYRARITVNGASIHLGLFGNTHDAEQAYKQAKEIYHKEKIQ